MPAALSPGAARVFLSVADAWYPVGRDAEEGPGASRVDLMAQVPAVLVPGETQRLEIGLRVLEWLPRLTLKRRGFGWLPREDRLALLERLEKTRLVPVRERAQRLRAIVGACYRAACTQPSSASA